MVALTKKTVKLSLSKALKHYHFHECCFPEYLTMTMTMIHLNRESYYKDN